MAVAAALAVATAAATERSIDALRQSDRAVLRGLPICLEEAHSEERPSCSIMSPDVRPSSHQISRVSKSKNSTRKEVTVALKGTIWRQEAEKRSTAWVRWDEPWMVPSL